MRARLPDESGYVVNAGVRIYHEVHGKGHPTILLLPTWAIIDSQHWKTQVPFLARHYRVITFDPRGNGKSGRPEDPAAYSDGSYLGDARAVMAATGTGRGGGRFQRWLFLVAAAGTVGSAAGAGPGPHRAFPAVHRIAAA